MPAKRSLEERLAKITEREARLDQEKKSVIARIARQERARDTRRKVLLGALSLYRIELNDTEHDAWIRKHLPGFLTRDGDKALFDDLIATNDHAGSQQRGSVTDQTMETLSR
ncbi:MAG: hypothetical protein WBD13_08685, partial [Burkholderiaceae bacterium]